MPARLERVTGGAGGVGGAGEGEGVCECLREVSPATLSGLGVGVLRDCCCFFSFQRVTLALAPRIKSCLLERSERRAEPSGSSNATTREEWVSAVREEGGRTQLGF